LGGFGHRLGEYEYRRVDTGVAQLHALFDERHRERTRTSVQRRATDGDCTVPVPVGLHDRAHLRGGDQVGERTDVGAYCAEVDLGPHRPVRRRAHVVRAMNRTMSARVTMPTTLPSLSTTGTLLTFCSCMSVATSSSVASGL